jgi:hypothetical protein
VLREASPVHEITSLTTAGRGQDPIGSPRPGVKVGLGCVRCMRCGPHPEADMKKEPDRLADVRVETVTHAGGVMTGLYQLMYVQVYVST